MEALPAAVAGRPLIADRVWSADGVRSVPGRFPGGLLQMVFSSDSVEAVAHAFLQFASTARSVRAAANLVPSEDKKAASGTAGIPESVLEFRLHLLPLGLGLLWRQEGEDHRMAKLERIKGSVTMFFGHQRCVRLGLHQQLDDLHSATRCRHQERRSAF